MGSAGTKEGEDKRIRLMMEFRFQFDQRWEVSYVCTGNSGDNNPVSKWGNPWTERFQAMCQVTGLSSHQRAGLPLSEGELRGTYGLPPAPLAGRSQRRLYSKEETKTDHVYLLERVPGGRVCGRRM